MLFTTYSYYAFLAVVVAVHWLLPRGVARSWWLVTCSPAFYTLSQGAFTLLLAAYVVGNWFVGRQLAAGRGGRGLLAGALVANILPLLYYKYSAFLAGSVLLPLGLVTQSALNGVPRDVPLGISFFAFQAAAYLVDISRGGTPIASLLDFAVFKTLWAQLVAGPIVRASELRSQLRDRLVLPGFVSVNAFRILNGLFKKVVLADSLGPVADQAFGAPVVGFVDAIAGILAFGLQIYFDFSAYSDIAIGSAGLVGFKLPENFDWPYASKSPQEFWQRWHMTLSRWIRDYVFTPLSLRFRRSPVLANASLIASMVLCGAWHGAGFTFLLWGFWHGLLLVLNTTTLRRFFVPVSRNAVSPVSPIRQFVSFAATLALVQFGWLFFRATSLHQVADFVTAISTLRGGLRPLAVRENGVLIVMLLWAATLLLQWNRDRLRLASERLATQALAYGPLRAIQAVSIIVLHQNSTSFIYFQF